MKEIMTYGLVLFFIVAIACGILAMVNERTAPEIEKNKEKVKETARKEVFPEATHFRAITTDTMSIYEALDIDEQVLGYTFIASGKGYNGKIYTMVGLYTDKTINRIKVIEQTETPGLGANCTKDDFLNRFPNLKLADLRLNKDSGKIESITGATITSRTIVNSIRQYIELLEETIEHRQKTSEEEVI